MKKTPSARRRILAVFSLRDKAGRDMFAGLLQTMSDRFDWELHMVEPGATFARRHVLGERYDGFIVSMPGTGDAMNALARSKTPTVLIDITDPAVAKRADAVSFIWTDNADIGRRGAEHLLSRGVRLSSYGFVHEIEKRFYSREREMAFRQRIREAGAVSVSYQAAGSAAETFQAGLQDWLKALPTPAGVMAASDIRAENVINACRSEGISVPNQVAVVGVDDDLAISARSPCTISSVLPDFFELGRQSVLELDFLFRHSRHQSRPHEIVVPAKTVVRRQSSSVTHRNITLVENAQAFIRENATTSLHANDVARHLGRSRPLVEREFKESTGLSIRQTIEAERLKLANQLRKREHLSVQDIAARLHFTSANQLSRIYRRHFGKTFTGRTAKRKATPTAAPSAPSLLPSVSPASWEQGRARRNPSCFPPARRAHT